MSIELVRHSPDLSRLEEEGYELEIRDSNLLVHHVPCRKADRTGSYGILVSELSHNGTRTIEPSTHVVLWVGEPPCDNLGQPLRIINGGPCAVGGGLEASCTMSGIHDGRKPADYYEKITHYVDLISRYAREIDPTVTARTYPPHGTTADESPFRYLDSASSRSGISAVTARLKLNAVAIVGLGGTGSYILDLVAKTPVGAIHIFDGDHLYAHNAFRAPGAASLDQLEMMPKKVDYFQALYDQIHRGVVAHPVYITEVNVDELKSMAFVFLAIEAGPVKREIVDALLARGVPFVDCGMGVQRVEDSLRGTVRTTLSTAEYHDHLARRLSFADEGADEYEHNIQTADLNMLNACQAVVMWKKLCGYYIDSALAHNTLYVVASNEIHNGDRAE